MLNSALLLNGQIPHQYEHLDTGITIERPLDIRITKELLRLTYICVS